MAIIPSHLLCQLEANPPKAEFQGTTFKLRETKFRRTVACLRSLFFPFLLSPFTLFFF